MGKLGIELSKNAVDVIFHGKKGEHLCLKCSNHQNCKLETFDDKILIDCDWFNDPVIRIKKEEVEK